MNHFIIPRGQPLQWRRAQNDPDTYYKDSIPFFENQVDYFQKFQNKERIRVEIIEYASVITQTSFKLQIKDCKYNQVVANFSPDYIFPLTNWNGYVVGVFSYIIPAGLAEGTYYAYMEFEFNSGQQEIYYSEPIYIQEEHKGTIQLAYTNSENDFDIYFGYDPYNVGSITFYFRVEGGWRSDGFQPSSIDNTFYDQTHNATLLSSVPYNVKKLTFGSNKGLPNYMIDKVNRILSCDTLHVDGFQYSKVEGAKLESEFSGFYPKGIWHIDMVEALNEYSDYASRVKIVGDGIGSMTINPAYPAIVGGGSFVVSDSIKFSKP